MEKESNYISMHRLEHHGEDAIIDPDAALDAEANAAALSGSLAKLDLGFTISRKVLEKQAPIELGLFAVWSKSMHHQEHVAAMAGYAQDVVSILHRSDPNDSSVTFGTMIRTRFGNTAWRALVSNENVMIRDTVFDGTEALGKVASWLASAAAVARLAYSLSVSAKQFTSYFKFIPFAGPKHMAIAAGKFVSSPLKTLERAYELDPQIRSRSGDASIETLTRRLPVWIQPGMAPMMAFDRWTAAIGFLATYDANIERGMSHRDALSEAQRAVNMTQNATSAKDKPLLWKQNSVIRLAMMFTGDAAKRLNIATYDMAQALRSDGGWNKIKNTFAVATGLAMGALLVHAISVGTPFDDDTEEEWDEWIGDAFAREAISTIPIIGNEALLAYERLMGKKRYGSVESVMFAPVSNVIKSLESFSEEDYGRAIWYATEALALTTGLVPATGLKRAINSVVMLGDGELGDAIDNMLGQRVWSEKAIR